MIAFTIAWLVSVSTLFWGEREYAGGISGVAFGLLPWMVLGGWPRSQPAEERTAALVPVGLAAAPIAMALFLQRREFLFLEAILGLVLLGILAWSASQAARSRQRRLRYGLSWLLLVLAVPLFHTTLGWLGSESPVVLRWIAQASPAHWAWGADGVPWTPLAECLGLLALANLGEADEEEMP